MILFILFSGQLPIQDREVMDEVPASLEVGLLGVVRRLITLLPDQRVRQIIGHALQHEALIAIAYNNNIVVRTAVIRVSPPISFKCGMYRALNVL